MHRHRLVAAAVLVATSLLACSDDDGSDVDAAASDEGPDDDPPTTSGTSGPSGTSGGEPPATATTAIEPEDDVQVVELTLTGGEVTSGGARVAVGAGQLVRFEVTSDVAEEVHVHGYDLEVAVPAGATTAFELVGDLPGVWEVELHGSGALLCQLEVAG